MTNWTINTTKWIGYSEENPTGLAIVPLVEYRSYPTYNDAWDEAKRTANRIGQTVYLGSATPWQAMVPADKRYQSQRTA